MPVPAVLAFTTASAAGRWRVERLSGHPGGFFDRAWPDAPGPTACVVRVDRPMLVLGSTQPDDVVDPARAARAGVEVLRRRSGGGAVLLHPGEVVWIDLFVPDGDTLWEPDLERSFAWLGRAWTEALGGLGVPAESVDRLREPGPWERMACFAATGAGEVTVGGRKVVGVSQRRSREGSRFQCAALLAWRAEDTAGLLTLAAPDRRRLGEHLDRSAAGLGLPAGVVEDAFLARLSTL